MMSLQVTAAGTTRGWRHELSTKAKKSAQRDGQRPQPQPLPQ